MSSCPDSNNVVFDEFALNTQKLGLLLRLSRLLNSDLPHHSHQIYEQCFIHVQMNNFNSLNLSPPVKLTVFKILCTISCM